MTKLLYMEGFDVTECEAAILKIEEHEGSKIIVLDQTCFYPKGGGQDFDLGMIKSGGSEFKVTGAFHVDKEVKHFGEFASNEFNIGDTVQCSVDTERRLLNTRLHSAGHTIDMAIRQLSYDWAPGKGAHYPHMSFVDYSGTFDPENKEQYVTDIQDKVNALLEQGTNNTIAFLTPAEMESKGAIVPENLPKDKPSRAMMYDDFAVPCGGTHVQDIKDIGEITVTKIRNKKGVIHLSYSVN